MKRCLRKVLGNARIGFDELTSVLSEVECTLNSRPITYQYEVLEEALTPPHLLFGYRLSPIAENIDVSLIDDFNDNDSLTNRFKYLSRIMSHFWKRWKHEYLVDLREFHRQKSNTAKCNISVGDVVLFQDEGKKRGLWKMGLIENLFTGQDGIVRGAAVRKSRNGKNETLKHSILKLFALELSSSTDHSSDELEGGSIDKGEAKAVRGVQVSRTRSA